MVAVGAVLAVGVGSTSRVADGVSRWGSADKVGISNKAVVTDTLALDCVTPGIQSAATLTARVDTLSVLADLILAGARRRSRAASRRAVTSRVRIAIHSLKALAGGAVGGDNALSVGSADHALALRDAFPV